MIHFVNKIRDTRLEKKFTQLQLAEKLTELGCKTSNTSIANWEKGLNKPDVDTLAGICEILEKNGNYFFNTIPPTADDNLINEIQNVYGNSFAILLNYYSQLNEVGQDKAIENVKDLTKIEEYTKEKKTDIQEAK